MEREYKQVRMRLSTYKALRQLIPAYEGEMMINYFERISNIVARGLNNEDGR